MRFLLLLLERKRNEKRAAGKPECSGVAWIAAPPINRR
jgi:hypothetical protein